MASIFNSMNYLRYKQSFDYSKVPVVKNKHRLHLEPTISPNNYIDELRINNALKKPPSPRIIPEVDLVEIERKRKYGERVDIQPETLFERFRTMVLRVPNRRADGTVIHFPPLPPARRRPYVVVPNQVVFRDMTFSQMLNDPPSLIYRVNQLINNANAMPAQLLQQNQNILNQHAVMGININDFRDNVRHELALIQQHLRNIGIDAPTDIIPHKIEIERTDVLTSEKLLAMRQLVEDPSLNISMVVNYNQLVNYGNLMTILSNNVGPNQISELIFRWEESPLTTIDINQDEDDVLYDFYGAEEEKKEPGPDISNISVESYSRSKVIEKVFQLKFDHHFVNNPNITVDQRNFIAERSKGFKNFIVYMKNQHDDLDVLDYNELIEDIAYYLNNISRLNEKWKKTEKDNLNKQQSVNVNKEILKKQLKNKRAKKNLAVADDKHHELFTRYQIKFELYTNRQLLKWSSVYGNMNDNWGAHSIYANNIEDLLRVIGERIAVNNVYDENGNRAFRSDTVENLDAFRDEVTKFI